MPCKMKLGFFVQVSCEQRSGVYVHHAVYRMLLAAHSHLTALDIQVRFVRAGPTRATLGDDAYHTVLSMLFAEYPDLASLGNEPHKDQALLVKTTPLLSAGFGNQMCQTAQ